MAEKITEGASSELITLSVTRPQLELIRTALEEYLATLSHEEGDLIDRVKALLTQLPDGYRPSHFQELTL